ncbi:DNA primase [Allonocardiopsis opalescens]|uniref:DNA primase n=2 Tax=Allonocardiopsis opalescens TaxID=1144618 RepID=A0A2T0QFL1_9ACTN|nr:DNA primase [Allonocardiopsis opalescens]
MAMAGRIRDEDIALVRERSPIDEVVGDYLQLRNAGGGSLKGLCPFHDERSPSFNVTPARGLYYCFGCGEGGDAITFVQKIDHLTFAEAIERLAQRAGVELRYEQGGYVPRNEQGQRARLLDAHRAAAEFYAERLLAPDASAGRSFLTERRFERADAERFGVGFAPREWDALTRHLRGKGFTEEELIRGGLASQGRRGVYDRFRNRLMWPIRDVTGDVVGFGARKLDPAEDGPKYLNTPETPLFKKSTLLYGIDAAKREISRQRQAVVVEGYTDVMACHLSGVGTAVATCGTSFGADHIKVLRRLLMDQDRFSGEVIFTFDGDEAGRKAALRAFADEHRFATQTFVAVQADGLDPCDLRVGQGEAAVRDLVAARTPLYEFAIRSTIEQHRLDTTEGRLAALDAAAPIVAAIKDEGLRQRYAVNLDRWLGLMDERFVLRRVGQHAHQSGRERSGEAPARPRPPAPLRSQLNADGRMVFLAWEALKLAVQQPALLPGFDELPAEVFELPEHAAVAQLIAKLGGLASPAAQQGGAHWVSALREAAADDALRARVAQLAVEAPRPSSDESLDRYAASVLDRINELSINPRIANVKSRLQRIDPAAQAEEYNALFLELIQLEQRRRMLNERGRGAV